MFAEAWWKNILLGAVEEVLDYKDDFVKIKLFTLLHTFETWVHKDQIKIINMED